MGFKQFNILRLFLGIWWISSQWFMNIMVHCEISISHITNHSIEIVFLDPSETLLEYELMDENFNFIKWNLTYLNLETIDGIKSNSSPSMKIENLISGMTYYTTFVGLLFKNGSHIFIRRYPKREFTTKLNSPSNLKCFYDRNSNALKVSWHSPLKQTIFKEYIISLYGQNSNASRKLIQIKDEEFRTSHTIFQNMTQYQNYEIDIQTSYDAELSENISAKCKDYGAPSDIKVDQMTSTSFIVYWKPMENSKEIDHYVVCVEDRSNFITEDISKSGPYFVNVSKGIEPDHEYKVHVMAYLVDDIKLMSEDVFIKTPSLVSTVNDSNKLQIYNKIKEITIMVNRNNLSYTLAFLMITVIICLFYINSKIRAKRLNNISDSLYVNFDNNLDEKDVLSLNTDNSPKII